MLIDTRGQAGTLARVRLNSKSAKGMCGQASASAGISYNTSTPWWCDTSIVNNCTSQGTWRLSTAEARRVNMCSTTALLQAALCCVRRQRSYRLPSVVFEDSALTGFPVLCSVTALIQASLCCVLPQRSYRLPCVVFNDSAHTGSSVLCSVTALIQAPLYHKESCLHLNNIPVLWKRNRNSLYYVQLEFIRYTRQIHIETGRSLILLCSVIQESQFHSIATSVTVFEICAFE